MKTKPKTAAATSTSSKVETSNLKAENSSLGIYAKVVEPFPIGENKRNDEYLANCGKTPLQRSEVMAYFTREIPGIPASVLKYDDEIAPLAILAELACHRLAFLAHSLASPTAAANLLGLTIQCVDHFERLARKNPAIFLPYSRRGSHIPVLFGPDSASRGEIGDLLRILEVSKDSPYRKMAKRTGKRGRRGPDPKTPANEWAIYLYGYVARCRDSFRRDFGPPLPGWLGDVVKLKDFDTKSYKQWHKVAWKIVRYFTDEKPEEHLELKKLGGRRKYHSLNKAGNQTPGGKRDGIREGLLGAFQVLAGEPSKK